MICELTLAMNKPPDPCSAHPILLLPCLTHQSKNECQTAAEIIHYPKGCYKARSCYVGLPPFMNLSFADPPTGSLRSARVQPISIREKLSFFEHPHPFVGSYPHEASQPRLLRLIPSSPSSRPLSAQLLKTNLLFCPLLDVSCPSVLVYKTYVAFSSCRSLEQVKVSGCPRVMIEYDEHTKAILWPPGHESTTSSLKSVLFWTVLQPDPLSREVFMKILPHSSSHRHQLMVGERDNLFLFSKAILQITPFGLPTSASDDITIGSLWGTACVPFTGGLMLQDLRRNAFKNYVCCFLVCGHFSYL